jgi:ribosomal protein S27AE
MIIIDNLDDPLLDESFEPCRDDRCSIDTLHAKHEVRWRQGRPTRQCPLCHRSSIIRVPRERMYCVSCSWEVSFNQRKTKSA